MEPITLGIVKDLVGARPGPAVSLYMPLHRSGPGNEQDPIRLKNLLRHAQSRLEELGVRAVEARAMLEPASRLEQNQHFWVFHSADGLAIFLARDFFRCYRVPHAFKEFVLVADSFNTRPLLPLLHHDGRYYLLALSRNAVRLYYGTRTGISPVSLPETVPQGMEQALAGTVIEQSLQHHAVTDGGPAGPSAGIIHGQGRPKDAEEGMLREYLRRVASSIADFLGNGHVPLVLVAVDYVHPMFRAVYESNRLLEGGVYGSPDSMTEQELHKRAWPLVEARLARELAEATGRYEELKGRGRTSVDLSTIIPAAGDSRVDTLFAVADGHAWGTYDETTREVVLHQQMQQGDIDLLNLAVEQTLLHGGAVHVGTAARIPSDAVTNSVAAIFRW